MRILPRAAAVALAAGSVLLTTAVAAQAAPTPAGEVTATVADRLILEPGQFGHTGRLRIALHNNTDQPYSGGFSFTEPIPGLTDGFGDTAFCWVNRHEDGRSVHLCDLWEALEPGGTALIDVDFVSPAKPQPFAQVAAHPATVEVAGVATGVTTLFRSTTGSVNDPAAYTPDTRPALTVTAVDTWLTRQPDGSFEGRTQVTVRNDGDAPHRELWAEVAVPAGVDSWPGIDPDGLCVGAGTLPAPEGGSAIGCEVAGGMLAEGQQRTFDWILRAPGQTEYGTLDDGRTLVLLDGYTPEQQTDDANLDSFAITVG